MAKIIGNNKTKISRILGTIPKLRKLYYFVNYGGKKERVGPAVKLYIMLNFIVGLAIRVTNKGIVIYKGGGTTIKRGL